MQCQALIAIDLTESLWFFSLVFNVVYHSIVLGYLTTNLKKVQEENFEKMLVSTCGVIKGVETQKLNERRRGKTVSRGFKSNMVTISFCTSRKTRNTSR